ncbi:hypothetical protein FIBSPDRAFT_912253 [Athelia psychrophila]|uniref:UbiA prenyltransferase n=1 Tax=Athelia psychrophila TaxID=1759441 RepID=A0A166FB72_9AGAM|nr:hypothetical protein FIBSPDRAFT_912253 [Fibularhizoctonia sp. CBS 109695]
MRRCFGGIRHGASTLYLIGASDYKTIFFPIAVFACVAAPVHSFPNFIYGLTWIWLHQLQCNVSNQFQSAAEDSINHPWRPLPSGMISERNMFIMRWVLPPLCVAVSLAFGRDVALTSIALTLTTVVYDEFALAGHWVGKNACNIAGYVSFEIGATKIMGAQSTLDHIAIAAVVLSGIIIFTTIQSQDFADVAGDVAIGRVTFPIYAPEASRMVTLVALVLWSVLLADLWKLGTFSGGVFCALGVYVGYRYYNLRSVKEDKESYRMYNLWLFLVHVLPAQSRWSILGV